MKRIRHIAGVTLLEIMLVLAIAAMIIVMSIRYYQSATAGSQANAVFSQIQGIVAAADSLAQASGSYSAGGAGASATLAPLLPGGTFSTPWGSAITVAAPASNKLTITVKGTPQSVCPLLRSRVMLNNHFSQTAPTACSASGTTDIVFTYVSNV